MLTIRFQLFIVFWNAVSLLDLWSDITDRCVIAQQSVLLGKKLHKGQIRSDMTK